MTKVSIRFENNILVISPAYSRRDTVANKIIAIHTDKSISEHYPVKRIYQTIPNVSVAIHMYVSNRGVPYLTIMSKDKKYDTNTINIGTIRTKLLKEFGLDEDITKSIIDDIKLFFGIY